MLTARQFPNGVTSRQIASTISSEIQELIILPTEKCNFRCTYCYEDFELGKMSVATQQGIERLIENRSSSLRKLKLSWFGGEPLLATDVILRISRFAQLQSVEHNYIVEGGLTTNAYLLTKDLADELISLQQDFFQITLDGWKEGHDLTRRRADGAGTFDRIWDNTFALKSIERQFEVVLRLHVRHDNLPSMYTLCKEIAQQFGPDPRFRVDIQDVRDMGGEGGKTVVGISKESLNSAKQELLLILNAGTSIDRAGKFASEVSAAAESAGSQRSAERSQSEPYICYAAKPNSLLIRSNGRIGKCTVALNDSRNDIGALNPDGSISVDENLLRTWVRGLGSLDLTELGCPAQNLPSVAKVVRLHKR
jgi:uncharacterized protein